LVPNHNRHGWSHGEGRQSHGIEETVQIFTAEDCGYDTMIGCDLSKREEDGVYHKVERTEELGTVSGKNL
jgi:hypothetical protein